MQSYRIRPASPKPTITIDIWLNGPRPPNHTSKRPTRVPIADAVSHPSSAIRSARHGNGRVRKLSDSISKLHAPALGCSQCKPLPLKPKEDRSSIATTPTTNTTRLCRSIHLLAGTLSFKHASIETSIDTACKYKPSLTLNQAQVLVQRKAAKAARGNSTFMTIENTVISSC